MTDMLISLVPALIGGSLIGLFFFGGLWWTVRRLPAAERPALFFLTSFVVRSLVTLVAFFVVAAGDWRRVLAAALGFLIARVLLVQLSPALEQASLQEVKSTDGTQS